jgi:hypothetical protein
MSQAYSKEVNVIGAYDLQGELTKERREKSLYNYAFLRRAVS